MSLENVLKLIRVYSMTLRIHFISHLVGCQATPRTLGDIEYVRTHLWNLSIIDYHVCIISHPHETHE